jgi:hypothetical protein
MSGDYVKLQSTVILAGGGPAKRVLELAARWTAGNEDDPGRTALVGFALHGAALTEGKAELILAWIETAQVHYLDMRQQNRHEPEHLRAAWVEAGQNLAEATWLIKKLKTRCADTSAFWVDW